MLRAFDHQGKCHVICIPKALFYFCPFIHFHIKYMFCPLNFSYNFQARRFFILQDICTYTKRARIRIFISFNFSQGASYVFYIHSQCTSNKSLFALKPPVSKFCTGAYFSLFLGF